MSLPDHPMAALIDSLSWTLDELRMPADVEKRKDLVAQAMRDLASLLATPPLEVPLEPCYHTAGDHRGDPFGPGEPIPYRRGTALHRAMGIFASASNPITRRRFIELGGLPRDLDRLLVAGDVVMFDFQTPPPT